MIGGSGGNSNTTSPEGSARIKLGSGSVSCSTRFKTQADSILYSILDNYISVGYLNLYCNNHFCCENLSFFMAVDRYKDILVINKTDTYSWKGCSYNEIDDRNKHVLAGPDITAEEACIFSPRTILAQCSEYPCEFSRWMVVQAEIQHIWDSYISSSAPSQICLSQSIISMFLKHLAYIHIYGDKIFDSVHDYIVLIILAIQLH